MMFGDLVGLKLPDIRLTDEETPRKNLTQVLVPIYINDISFPSNLTSCTPTIANLYLTISCVANISAPVLYKLLTFEVPNFIPLFVF